VPAPPLASTPEYALEPHFEYVLAHYLERRDDPRAFFFVQIGAFDGVVHDPLFERVRDGHWHGVLVEPQEEPFEKLRRNYAGADGLRFVNAAVDSGRGQRELHRLEDGDGEAIASLAHLATLSRARLEDWRLHDGGSTRAEIGSVAVECATFEDLLRDVTYLDLLHMDAEGYDLELLKLFDFSRGAPPIVRFEHAHLARPRWDEAVALLARHGYRIVAEEYDTTAYRLGRAAPAEVSRRRRSD
jgi:FkbM family methyltransferase